MPKISAWNFCALTVLLKTCRGEVIWPTVKCPCRVEKSLGNIKVVHSLVIQIAQPSLSTKWARAAVLCR